MKKKTLIIAEAGVNHNGSVDIAKELIKAAKDVGADAVKFQTFNTNSLVAKNADKADYQKKSTDKNESQFEMIKQLELNEDNHKELMKYCHENDIQFISSPFDFESIELLNELGLEIFKIPSGEIINLPYLTKIGKLNKKVFLSTGMSNLGEIEEALNTLIIAGTIKENITVLHCNTEYPTPYKDVNLNAMCSIKDAFQVKIGYSDHTEGIEIAIAAVALGAEIIEKHFTLDKNMKGPDHKASLEPDEFNMMVKAIRNIESGLGDGIKRCSESELKNINVVRKSIVALKPIFKDEKFSDLNIGLKRPGIGISPKYWHFVLGKVAKKNFDIDELIEL